MLVGPASRSRHLLSILAYAVEDRLTFLLCGIVLDIAALCFTRGSSSLRQRTRLEAERQLSADELDDVTLPDLAARPCPLAIDPDVPAAHGSGRQPPCLVEAREPQPSIYAQ